MFGGFGNNQNSTFGNQPNNTGGFGSQFTNTTAGFGGFGQPSQPPQQQNTFGDSQGFGSSGFNQPAPAFASNQPAFSSQPTTGFGAGTAFGGFGQQQQQQPTNTFQSGSAFMGNTTPSGFGGMNTTSLSTNQGTGNPSYAPTQDKESGAILSSMSVFHTISAMPAYKNWSFEELRVADYSMNKKYSGSATGGGFGASAFGSTMQAPSAFGASTNVQPTGGFGSMNTSSSGFGGFGAASTPAFGAQSAAPQTGGFGASAAPAFGASTGGFGQTQGTTAFGQKPAAATPWGAPAAGSTFGAAPAFGSQSTAATGATPWGAPASTSAFGAQSTTAPAPFGQQAQSGGLFGAKPATGGFSFSQPTAAPAPTGGLFGATTTTSAPLFGATQQPAPSTGLFGAGTAAKTGFSFGATTTAPTQFGTSIPTSTPSLFGSSAGLGQPAVGGSLFGAPSVTSQPGTGLFGTPAAATTQAPGGLFGSSLAPKVGGFGSFPTATPVGGATGLSTGGVGGLFGQSPGMNTFSTPGMFQPATSGLMVRTPGQNLTASIDRNPYGVNPLFTPSKASTEQPSVPLTEPAVLSLKTTEKKKAILTPHFKVTPRSTSKVKLRGFAGTSPVATPSIPESKSSLKMQPTIVKEQNVNGLDSRFTPRKTMTKLIISETPGTSIPALLSQKQSKSAAKEVTFDPSLEEVALSSIREKDIRVESVNEVSKKLDSSPSKAPDSSSVLSSPQFVQAKSTDYMIEPPLSDLLLLSDEELHAVSDFKVSLEGIGWVKFLRPVDLLQASPTGTRAGIEQIPGSIVILEPKICTVYPDENVKPPCGFGLNVPAEINIEKCWPLDKSTRKPILDESDPRHDRHMQKLERMPGTKWLGFHNPTGTWRFRVEHFSRYGLIDDDSEEDLDDRTVPQETADSEGKIFLEDFTEDESLAKDSFAYVKGRVELSKDFSFEEDDENGVNDELSDEDLSEYDMNESEDHSENDISVMKSHESDEDIISFDEENIESRNSTISGISRTSPAPGMEKPMYVTSTNTPGLVQKRDLARKVQTLKSSLFSNNGKTKMEKSIMKPMQSSTPLRFDLKATINDTNERHSKRETGDFSPKSRDLDSRMDFELSVPDQTVLSSPRKYRKSFPQNHFKTIPPIDKSVLHGNEKQIADASLFMSRSFRVGWGNNFLIRKR